MAWYDSFKLFTFAFAKDPLQKKRDKNQFPSAGVTQPDARINNDLIDGLSSGANAFIRIQNDLIDLTTTTNRANRYKEYDRLSASVPEIEMAMTAIADEACIAGNTEIATVFYGFKTIEWLTKNKAEERFPVYCYDFEEEDYTIGWAFAPRVVKEENTLKICLDNGTYETVTADHRILKRDGTWTMAQNLKFGDQLMPFYRLDTNLNLTKQRSKQFPRIWTHKNRWIHERQFIDEWRLGKKNPRYEEVNRIIRYIGMGYGVVNTAKYLGTNKQTINSKLQREGFSYNEVKQLDKRHPDVRRVIGIHPGPRIKVYDLSVEKHENFCTKSLVMHNCQKNDDGEVFKIESKNTNAVKELRKLFFHRDYLNFNQRTCWDRFKRLCIKGDAFWEIVVNPDNPKEGIYHLMDLPPETMYRIESTKGKLIEFQQSNEGPDYEALKRSPVTDTDAELAAAKAIRFTPDEIVHTRLGDYRKSFYPYGVSLIEAARGAAHQLRMMEDAMVVYRLTRAPERRVFYIDVGQLPSHKSEAYIDRLKDQFRKKKIVSGTRNGGGASAVEERYHAVAQDEDYWVPIRQNSATRIDTLPGAENLGEIDDTVYFRNKLFTALNFPKNYFSAEDPNSTRITISSQNAQFAQMIERLQSYFEDALWEVANRHLFLRGIPPESYDDLKIIMTPPSNWRELSKADVTTNRISIATSLKGSQLMADYDILTKWMKYSEEDANEMISRNKIQTLENLKIQIMQSNPALLGVGIPGEGENELGAEPGGPNPMLEPGAGGNPAAPQPNQAPTPPMPPPPNEDTMMPPSNQAQPLPDPSEDDILKYDLEITNYDVDMDEEDIDWSDNGD